MSQDEIENKGESRSDQRRRAAGLTRFWFPNEQVAVYATTAEEAEKKMREIIKNKE